MTIIKAFTVPNEANRKKRETQRKAVLWSRKVFKSLPKAGCIFNAPCIDCAVLRRFTYQGLTRWVITLQTKKTSMARSTFKVLFYVNGSKERNGIVPIMGRVTINGTVAQFSCKQSVLWQWQAYPYDFDLRPIVEWFKEQFEKLQQRIHRPVSPQRKDRGMKL